MVRRGVPWAVGAAVAAWAAVGGGARGQQGLYSNAGASAEIPALGLSPSTLSGVAAPAGGLWSEVSGGTAECNALAGVSGAGVAGAAGTFRFADDFAVGVGPSWAIQTVWLYAYQPGAPLSGGAGVGGSPFASVNVRVWNGPPDAPASLVVFGDASTNRLLSAQPANAYRVFNSSVAPMTPPDTARALWRLDVALPVTLAPGTYWLDWQLIAADPSGDAFSPTATVPGTRAAAGWNARQFRPATPPLVGGQWVALTDGGKPSSAPDVAVALPFVIRGGTVCRADFDGQNGVDLLDIFAFLGAWFSGDPRADYTGIGGVDLLDIFGFLEAWFAGCP